MALAQEAQVSVPGTMQISVWPWLAHPPPEALPVVSFTIKPVVLCLDGLQVAPHQVELRHTRVITSLASQRNHQARLSCSAPMPVPEPTSILQTLLRLNSFQVHLQLSR
jgi:hypothetical protein